MSLTLDCTSAPFVLHGKKFKLNSVSDDSGRKKCKRRCGGVWRSLCLAGIWSQAVGFVLLRLAGIWLQSPSRFFYIQCTLQRHFINFVLCAICEDNAAINSITVHKKKGSFPSTLTGRTTLV
jgi:hypothetical protein